MVATHFSVRDLREFRKVFKSYATWGDLGVLVGQLEKRLDGQEQVGKKGEKATGRSRWLYKQSMGVVPMVGLPRLFLFPVESVERCWTSPRLQKQQRRHELRRASEHAGQHNPSCAGRAREPGRGTVGRLKAFFRRGVALSGDIWGCLQPILGLYNGIWLIGINWNANKLVAIHLINEFQTSPSVE